MESMILPHALVTLTASIGWDRFIAHVQGGKTRMRKFAAGLLFLLLATAAFGQSWFPGSLDEALTKAQAEGKLVLVNFFSGG